MVTFIKEFENYILSDNNEDVLLSVIPGGEAEIYLQLMKHLKSVDNKIPQELWNTLNRARLELNQNVWKDTNLLILLKEFDLEITTPDRKKEIVKEIQNLFFRYTNFDFPKPANVQMVLDGPSNLLTGYSDKIDESIFDVNTIITQYLSKPEDASLLQNIDQNHFLQYVNLEKMPEIFFRQWIVNRNFNFPLSQMSDESLQSFAKYVDKFSNENSYAPDISNLLKLMTVEQITKLADSDLITTQYYDKNDLINNIITKKYYSQLNSCENEFEKREIYLQIYSLIKDKPSKFNALKANVLLEILQKGRELKIFDIYLFKEYLANPCTANEAIYRFKEPSKKKQISEQRRYQICGQNFTTDENKIVKAYLSYFFLFENLKIKDFEDLLNYEYLNREYHTACVLKGEESDESIKVLGKKNYEELIKNTQITICEHNKTKFEVDELVKIEVDVKNIQTLFVKIFEINTENYYYSKKAALNSNISLEGLITTNEETYSYNEKPQKLVRRVYEFDKIPQKRGVYIIEFIGGGYSSRAIIKKGGLSLVTRSTSKGQFIFILNENSEICKSEGTGVWFKDNFYHCDRDMGHVVIPYMKQTSTEPCILVHENFAEIAKLTITEEKYELKGTFHINHESLIMGNVAKVLFKPFLYINGRVSKIEYLKNSKITAKLTKVENDSQIPISSVFDKLTVSNDRDIEIELQIPNKLLSIELNFEAEVYNYSKEKNDKLNISHIVSLSSGIDDNNFSKLFLRQINSDNEKPNYILSLLGKNGEPKPNQLIKLTFNHQIIKKNITHNLQTDSKGEVHLGALENITSFNANVDWYNKNISSSWSLPSNAVFSYPSSIDILANESITLPFSGNKIHETVISFEKVSQNSEVIQNLLPSLRLSPRNEDNSRFNLVIENLDQGSYVLFFKNLNKTISIKVHAGKIWETQNFIITKNKIIENSEFRNPIYISDIKYNTENSSIHIKVNSKLPSSRVHIFTHNFLNNDVYSLSNSAINIISSAIYKSENPFQLWKNIYLSNRILNDEIQYVFDRKYLERYLGNSLERPSLLIKRQFVRDTTTDNEQLEMGNDYQTMDLDRIEENMMLSGDRFYSKYPNEQILNTYSDFHNFLAHSPLCLLNIKPNSEGEIVLKDFPLNRYSHLQIVALDERSISEELVALPSTPEIEKRNLALEHPLDIDKTYSEIRNTLIYKKNEQILISDISSTRYKIIDSLEKVVNYQLLTNSSLTSDWNNFSFLLKFSELSEDEQKRKFSKFFSHEINLFLYFKYPAFFEKYVRPVLVYKCEKTFIDYFLLNDVVSLNKFAESSRIEDLNALERCLLIHFLINNRKEDDSFAKNIRNTMKAMVNKDELNPDKLKRLFGIMMNMKADDEQATNIPIVPMSNNLNNFDGMLFSRAQAAYNPYSNMIDMAEMYSGEGTRRCMALEEKLEDDYGEEQEEISDIQFKKMRLKSANRKNDRFLECEELDNNYSIINARNNLYKNPGSSKEYHETHYYNRAVIYPGEHIVQISNFWIDFATHLLNSSNNTNFLSKNILLPCNNNTELILLLAVLDLPFTSSSHQFNRKEGRSLEIIPTSNLILFTKEIREASSKLGSNLMIAQNIVELTQDPYNDTQIKEFLVNKVYVHETIVTNISTKKMTFELLIQVPQGSIPVMNSEYTKTINFSLEKFNTNNFKTYFYFPDITGTFIQYPPNAAIDGVVIFKGEMLTYNVVRSLQTQSKESLDDVLTSGNKNDILEFINKNNKFNPEDLSKVYWLLKDKDFYSSLIDILRKKRIYNQIVWSFSMYHIDVDSLREYLGLSPEIKQAVGPKFNSSLVKIDETSNNDVLNHLDYHPIFNARVHRLGRESNVAIMNKEFKETYEKYIIYLLRLKPEEFDAKCWIRLCYYLILQDRFEEALKVFTKINTSEFNENSSLLIQYDYIAAYLDFCVGYPDFKIAKEICVKYKNFPLLHWRDLFEEIEDQIIEYEGNEVFSDIDSLIDEEKKKKQMVKNVITTLPTLSFNIENKTLQIQHSNIEMLTIKFYLIDLEILFSRTPFIKSNTDDFSFVQPNFVKQVTVNSTPKEELLTFHIPEEFVSKNLFIEVSSINKKAFDTYFSTSLKVTISENLGEIKITDNKLKPLQKAYVKCYAKMNDGSVKFYKDGYTDLRGKFNYILLNTDQLKNLSRFAVFVMHDEFGSIIKECNPPSNIKKDDATSDYDNYQNYRQEIKQLWRSKNKL